MNYFSTYPNLNPETWNLQSGGVKFCNCAAQLCPTLVMADGFALSTILLSAALFWGLTGAPNGVEWNCHPFSTATEACSPDNTSTMQAPIADNFDLYINRAAQDHYALTVVSPQGETQEPVLVRIDPNDEKLRHELEKAQAATITAEELRALGQLLGSYLFPPGVIRELFKSSLDQARRAGKRLRIRLRITPPEIAAIPWELTYDESIQDFFVLHPATWLIRYPNLPIAPGSVASLTPVPILSIVAQPVDFPPELNLLAEVKGLIEACQSLLDRAAITVDLLFGGRPAERSALAELAANQPGIQLLEQRATLDQLRDLLRTRPYRILHFLGHGSFQEEQGGQLILTDAQGAADFITDELFARELQDRGLALAILNACQSASQAPERAFMGVAPRLIQAGLPAVIAMQADILDSSAILFAQTLFRALADGWPIDAAVTEGRKAIRAKLPIDRADWGTPVLFMRAVDGQIFAHGVAHEELSAPVRALQTQAEVVAEQARLTQQQERAALAVGLKNYLNRLQKQIHPPAEEGQSTPYRGLLAYGLRDSALFFGRQQARQQLTQVLARGPLTVLQGQSGAGKTSLLQAGLIPQLVAQGHLVALIRAYNQPPTQALQQTLLAGATDYPALLKLPLVQFMHLVVNMLGDAHPPCIIFDQFEEFFTQLDQAEQTAFMDELAACLNDSTLPVRWVLALRTEFYGQLANFSQLGTNYVNQYTLKELSAAEAEESITRPLAAYGIALAEGLAPRIVQDVRQQQGVLPPQLQIICLTLYEKLALPEQTIITQTLYDTLGGARGILQGHLAQVLQRDLLSPEASTGRRLLEELVTSTGQRRVCAEADLLGALEPSPAEAALARPVLAKLVRARLLRIWESQAGVPGVFYELAHDYLIDQIQLEPGVRQRKEAAELVARAQINWEKYRALLDAQTFPVIHAQRAALHLPANAWELLVRSALATDVDPAWWLHQAPPAVAHGAIVETLLKGEPATRLRLVALARPFAHHQDVQQALIQRVLADPDALVRRLAFTTLAQADPRLRAQLLPRYWAIIAQAMLEKYRRLTFILVAPLVVAFLGWNLYLWWISWPWAHVPGAPTTAPIQSLAVLEDQIFLGGRDDGFQHSRNGQWLAEWLPPPIDRDEQGYYPAISAIAVDPVHTERIYLYVWQQGLFHLNEPAQQWTRLGETALPVVEQPVLAVNNDQLLFATQSAGLYLSQDGGGSWRPEPDETLGEVLYSAFFDQAGVAYVGGRNGLFRTKSLSATSWEWVVHVPVQHVALGAGDLVYIAGEQVSEVTCYRTQPLFQPNGTAISFFWPLPGRRVAKVVGHPTQPGVFYVVDSFAGVYQFNCDRSRPRLVGRVWGVERGVNGMDVQQLSSTQFRLIQANGQGLYWTSPTVMEP